MKKISLALLSCSVITSVYADNTALQDFEFERYAVGLNATITPNGEVAWQQSLPTVSHEEYQTTQGELKQTTLQTDSLLRIGVGHDSEIRLGWQGWQWQREKREATNVDEHQLGDVSIGFKKRLIKDDDLQWAVIAQADLATGERKFGDERHDKFSLMSAVDYRYNDLVQTSMTMKYAYQNKDLSFTAVPALRYKIGEHTMGYSEYVGQKIEGQKWSSRVNQGILFNINRKAQIDMWLGYGFSRHIPRYHGGLGFSYLFR